MDQIVKPQERPSKLWGAPKPKETSYRLMRYCLAEPCEDGTLLHNAVTGELVLLDAEEASLLSRLPAAHEPIMDGLIAGHFLVPEDFNETRSVDQLRALERTMHRPKTITGYTILPTTCCNARCFYCYEADYPHITMTEETADELIEFIAAHRGEDKVSLSWFGGEPTLGVHIIDKICKAMEEREIKYSSSMISNGYLFTPELAEKAKNLWKLKSIQITLDGTEETYNKVKAYVHTESSAYRRVLENIRLLLAQEIRVSIRMNLDRHNETDLEQLIAELADRFAGEKYIGAYVHPLFDDCGFRPMHHEAEETERLERKATELNALIAQKQLRNDKRGGLPALKFNYCMADNDASVIVNPDGTFSKCEHYCCTEILGSLKEGFTDQPRLKEWKQRAWFPECETCPLVPSCMKLKNCFSCGRCLAPEREREIQNVHAEMKEAWTKQKSKNEEENHEEV